MTILLGDNSYTAGGAYSSGGGGVSAMERAAYNAVATGVATAVYYIGGPSSQSSIYIALYNSSETLMGHGGPFTTNGVDGVFSGPFALTADTSLAVTVGQKYYIVIAHSGSSIVNVGVGNGANSYGRQDNVSGANTFASTNTFNPSSTTGGTMPASWNGYAGGDIAAYVDGTTGAPSSQYGSNDLYF